MERAKEFLKSMFGREGDTLSRRDALAGLGLAGLLLATPRLLGPAEAKPLGQPTDAAAAPKTNATDTAEVQEAAFENADDTEVTSRRHWRHRHWRRRWRRHWRRRYWFHRRRRWWRRRHWRRRYWRSRYW